MKIFHSRTLRVYPRGGGHYRTFQLEGIQKRRFWEKCPCSSPYALACQEPRSPARFRVYNPEIWRFGKTCALNPDHQINYNCCNEPFTDSPYRCVHWDMHGLIFDYWQDQPGLFYMQAHFGVSIDIEPHAQFHNRIKNTSADNTRLGLKSCSWKNVRQCFFWAPNLALLENSFPLGAACATSCA